MSRVESDTPRSSRALDPPYAAALACFFLSGFAALLYQTVWTRQFAFVFGTADVAVATVLAAYMGGLAFGAWLGARVAPRVTRPLLAYAVLEVAIGAAALLVPVAVRGVTAVAVRVFGGDALPPTAGAGLASFYLVSAFAILLVPTACMGATLPLLARLAVRSDAELTVRVGTLYATNTAGAVAGAWAAGFVLLPWLGLTRTVLVGAASNVVVGVIAVYAASGSSARAFVPPPPPRVADGPRLIPLVLLLSGMTSFTYEVVWTRLLGHVLGGSTYAFATMLATFLAGIAIGAALAARLAATPARAARGLAIAEVGIAVTSLAAFRVLDELPRLAVALGAGRDPTRIANVALAALVMLPSTLAIGATFPLAVRALARDCGDAAAATARIYAWNTAGAIVGALGAGFFLMPWLGYAGIVAAAAAVNLLLGLVVALASPYRSVPVAALAALAGVGLAVWPPTTPWQLVATSPLSPGRSARIPEFFAVGRSAGVTVAAEGGVWKLRTNGLPEGVMLPPRRYRRAIPDRWLGALPFLARPDARRVLVVGLGAGTALEALPPVEDLDVIELEPRVIEANERYRARRAVDPLAHPGLRLHVDDARGALMRTTKRWDIVVSQPSHPWTTGASHLYTREFFTAVRDHLAPGGVFVQWIDLDIVDQPLFASLLATLVETYPHVRVYRPFFRSTALLIASTTPLAVEANASRALDAAPVVLARAGVQAPEDVAAAFALDEDGVRRLAAGAPITTDDRNLLEARTIKVTAPLGYRGADELLAPFDPLPAAVGGLDRLYLVRRLLADWDFPRAGRVAATLRDPVERATAAGLVALVMERRADGLVSLRSALALDANAYEARVALLRAERARLVAGDPEIVPLAVPPLGDPMAAVVAGWSLEAAGEWGGVQALEPRLAGVSPRDAAFGDALRLRAAWRMASGDASAAVEALGLLDRVLPLSLDPNDYLQRANAALVAGDVGTAIESLTQALDSSTPGNFRTMAARVAARAAALPPAPEFAEERDLLDRKIAAFRR